MHLLLAQKGSISDGDEAVDLGQSPADLLFLTAADTELAAVAIARQTGGQTMPQLRLANLMQLKHPMSVDSYVERTARHARLIIVRALGGASYFSYALEALHGAAMSNGIEIAVLPGDDKPDPGLDRFCSLPTQDVLALWQYLVEGGADNSQAFLAYCQALLEKTERPAAALPLLKSGLWWPNVSNPRLEDIVSSNNERPVVPICFYRALVQSGQTQPVWALAEALENEACSRCLFLFQVSRIRFLLLP